MYKGKNKNAPFYGYLIEIFFWAQVNMSLLLVKKKLPEDCYFNKAPTDDPTKYSFTYFITFSFSSS